MSHVSQYMHLRCKLHNAQAVNDEKLENQLLDEMDAVWNSSTEDQRDEIKRLVDKSR
jgi:hypothetical protein